MKREDMNANQIQRADMKGRDGKFRACPPCDVCGKPSMVHPTVIDPGGWTWCLCKKHHKEITAIAPEGVDDLDALNRAMEWLLQARRNHLTKVASPTKEQIDAVLAYADSRGKTWKAQLQRDWMKAGSTWSGPYHLLHQLRNTHGPAWLEKFEI